MLLALQLISNIAMSSLTCRDQSNTHYSGYGHFSVLYDTKMIYLSCSQYSSQYIVGFFWAAIAYRTDDFSELLMSPTSLSWIATATSEVSIVRHGLDYFSLDVLLPFIHIQWRSSDVTFCPFAFVVSFWSALLLPSDKNELSIVKTQRFC